MKNIFKSLTPKTETEAKSENIDEQIYKDAYSAQDLLLQEAVETINNTSVYDEEKHTRLTKLYQLGFSSANEVKEFKELEDRKVKAEELKGQIEYYQKTYPLNKFINEDAVKSLCSKYGLLLAFSRDYIAEIPEKNQNEIVEFKVKRCDKRYPTEISSSFWRTWMMPLPYIMEEFSSSSKIRDYENEKIPGQDLLIIAPPHKLNMEGKEVKGHKLMIKDPIVLQPVKGGYLIISSWGFEASDEIVVNPINQ